MENTLRLYHTLVQVLRQHRNWLDVRHLKTLAWMKVHRLYAPWAQQALSERGQNVLYLALNTSMLWGKHRIIRISTVYQQDELCLTPCPQNRGRVTHQ